MPLSANPFISQDDRRVDSFRAVKEECRILRKSWQCRSTLSENDSDGVLDLGTINLIVHFVVKFKFSTKRSFPLICPEFFFLLYYLHKKGLRFQWVIS